MADQAAAARAYLERLGLSDQAVQRLLATGAEPTIAAAQGCFAQELGGEAAGEADEPWLRAVVQRAYGLPLPAPQRALMPALLPLRRQHMTARALHRGVFRQLLGMFVYRPAARLLRVFQVLAGRTERA